MNFWTTGPLTICAILAAGCAVALHLTISTRIALRRSEERHLAESQCLRDAIAALESKLQDACAEMKQNMLPPAAYTPFTGLNVQKRSEALRMYRHGSDNHTVAAALGMPLAEVALLKKVHHLLTGRAASLDSNEKKQRV